ncbi:uncharacterized protein EAF01_005410 [Botrytis porri]|uniref:uncharacterized protein n=1 Tax=Botrytis porri TaxID=87229 RepID=UPI0019025CFE|nr:uncharacterized protein EAF01_005410 [Botrytis porri]KAF7904888.1 hypothetical protein EAF01_005410 [Botrytis porri]
MQTLSLPRAIVGFIIDIYLIIIPLIAVSKLKPTPRKKIGVGLIFATGFIATIGSILSIIYRLRIDNNDDVLWNLSGVALVSLLEILLGIFIACTIDISRFICMYRGRFKDIRCSLLSCSGCRNMMKTRKIRKLTKPIDNNSKESVREDENKHEKPIKLYPGLDISETPPGSASSNVETSRPSNGNEMPLRVVLAPGFWVRGSFCSI